MKITVPVAVQMLRDPVRMKQSGGGDQKNQYGIFQF